MRNREVDDIFAPGQLEVGALTLSERTEILNEGSSLSIDPLWTRDEVLRRRRALRVVSDWRECQECQRWTERKPEEPCGNCGHVVNEAP
jgi:uncharacterized paraquat-inducible protein A